MEPSLASHPLGLNLGAETYHSPLERGRQRFLPAGQKEYLDLKNLLAPWDVSTNME